MLEVLPIQSKAEQEAVCADCGIPYDVDCMAYHALVDGRPAGVCQFRMNDKGGFICGLGMASAGVPEDPMLSDKDRAEAIFVMGRAALNFIDLCGVHAAYFIDEHFTDEAMIRAIGFRRGDDGVWFMDLTDFFTSSPCQHCGN